MRQEVAHRDRARHLRVGDPEAGQELDDRLVEPRRPSSTSCMTRVAVRTFVIEPIWKTESAVTSTPVAVLSTPAPTAEISPSRRIPSVAPGTRCRARAFGAVREVGGGASDGLPAGHPE